LIKPVQRLCKYPLLLRELIKNTNTDHPDYKPLEKAFKKTSLVVDEVNESKRVAENLRKLLHIERYVEKKSNLKIVTPGRMFIKEGALTKVSPHGKHQERHFFLFSDMIMWSRKHTIKNTFEFKGFAPLGRCSLSDARDIKNGFYITRSDTQKRYSIYAKDADEKKVWFAQLQKHISQCWQQNAESVVSTKKSPAATALSKRFQLHKEESSARLAQLLMGDSPSRAAFIILCHSKEKKITNYWQ